jgi:hypothetical protein
LKSLIQALIKFQSSVPLIPKNCVNPFFSQGAKKAMYADLATVIDVCKPHLNKSGLAVIQTLKVVDARDCLVTILAHESGECMESVIRLPEITDAQKLTGAITYFRRSSYLAILGLVGDEDDDGNSIVQNKPVQQSAPRQANDFNTTNLATAAQLGALKKMGIQYSEGITRSEASELIKSGNSK